MNVNNFEDNIKTGWISLFRSIREHWVWDDPIKFKWWIDILLEVNHKDKYVNIGNNIIDCKKGQSVMSLLNWGKRWNVSKDTARNFLKLLQKDNMILLENLKKTTRLTVLNYNTYQNEIHDKQTQNKRKTNAKQTLTDPNNNVNNANNGINKIIPPQIEWVKEYCIERNNNVDFNKWFDFYTSKNWMIGKNKMKDWKAAVRTWEEKTKNNIGKPKMVW